LYNIADLSAEILDNRAIILNHFRIISIVSFFETVKCFQGQLHFVKYISDVLTRPV